MNGLDLSAHVLLVGPPNLNFVVHRDLVAGASRRDRVELGGPRTQLHRLDEGLFRVELGPVEVQVP